MKKLIVTVLMAVFVHSAFAQSGTNSPYSQYGLGVLADQSQGMSRGMNGLAYGFHERNQVNSVNPASYSAIDSLSFIFDAGLSAQITNFEEGGVKKNARNADFEYVVAGFRAFKHVGVSFGLLPYTTVGYNFSNTGYVDNNRSTTYTNTFNGDGGLHQVYLGVGWEPLRGLSLGVNGSYLWGSYDRSVTSSYSDAYVNTLSKYYSADVASYKVDFGLQYTARLTKKDQVTLGLTYSLGHKLGSNPECLVVSRNSQTGISDTTRYVVSDGLEIPKTVGAGLMWNHNNQLKVGVDYQLMKWSETSFPLYQNVNGKAGYALNDQAFSDRHKITLGGEYCKGGQSRMPRFYERIHYRAGISYATPYIKINGQDGPKELSASLGVGIPINRSMLNISGQWVRQESDLFIKENTFRINVGFTFNERWFAKFKVQ